MQSITRALNSILFYKLSLKVTDSVEEMLLGLEQRKKGDQDMEGVKLGKFN